MKIAPYEPGVTARSLLESRVRSLLTPKPFIVAVCAAAACCGVVLLAHSGVQEPVYGEAMAIFGSAVASSVAGFAFSALCGAFLFHDGSAPRHVVQLMAISSIAIQALSVVSLWRSISWRTLRAYVLGGAFGLPIGLFLLCHVSTSSYGRAMGIFLVAYGTNLLWRRPFIARVGTRTATIIDTAAGFLGGITGGAAGTPGAFVAIWCAHRGWDKFAQRSIIQPFILIMQIATVAALVTIDPSRTNHVALLDVSDVAFVPVALCGTYCGMHIFRRLSDRAVTRALSLLLIASGIGLVGAR